MNIDAIVSEASSIAISGHVRPDGDCVGSCLALYNYVKTYYKEKEVVVYLETIPSKFMRFSGADEIVHEAEEDKVYDVYFAMDCAASDRIGFAMNMYNKAKIQCCVDHHISNPGQGEYVHIVPTASSTSELVFDLLDDEKITKEIAECLYLGISHDTGVFQYSNVSPSTMRAAATLLEKGISANEIIVETYYEKTHLQNQMLGKAFMESKLYLDGRCIAYGFTWDEMQRYGVDSKDLDSIVSELRNTKDVDVAIFMYALSEEEFKVSLRAKTDVDVSKIATHFQGGGHKKAAGFSVTGTYEEQLELILEQIRRAYD